MRFLAKTVFVILGLGVSLSACEMSAPISETSFKSQSGVYQVVAEEVTLSYPAQDKDLTLQVSYPENGEGPFPLIVFSHGAMCAKNTYSGVVNHWVSHGYVVIEPTHLDSRTLGQISFADLGWIADTRPLDMSFILDSLDDIESAAPGLEGKIDRSRIAASGHSMGAATAQRATGLDIFNSKREIQSLTDDRFDVAVLLSAPGQMPNIPEQAWEGYQTPMMMTTGTKDVTRTNMNRPEGWAWRMGSYNLSPAGDKYALVTQDMDHFLGGLICREVEGEEDQEALGIVGGATTAFLDAYLKDDAEAKQFISSDKIDSLTNGRAELKSK